MHTCRIMRPIGLLILLFLFYASHFSTCAFAQWSEQSPILQASDEVDTAFFGSSVALSGDVAVVGAWFHPSGGTSRGEAYVYRRNGSVWGEEQILQASDEEDDANFGYSVAVSGNAAVVGAYRHSSGGAPGAQWGQTYVYRYDGAAWVEEQILRASDEVTGGGFGISVAIDGNVAVIGGFGHPSGGEQRGQAYVFRYNGTTWMEEGILQASDEVDFASFGYAVAVNGSVAVVGAFNYFTPLKGFMGQAYIYRYSGAGWPEEQVLKASDESNYAQFGASVAVSGDVVVVGALNHPGGGINRGQAYVLRYNGASWAEEQILKASDGVDQALFGRSVAVDGNVALIGGPGNPSGGTNRGQTYVYRYNGATWPERQILQASDEADGSGFGVSVAVDGDGIVVGANGHPSGGTHRGQAYAFGPSPNVARDWKIHE